MDADNIMNLNRFYCNPITEPLTELLGAEAGHLSAVRRLTAGDKVELFDGKGCLAAATIKTANSRKITLQIDDKKIFQRPPASRIIIAASIAKTDRFDWLLSKCTELGVDRITPVLFERTVKQPKNAKIADRWQKITISAAKQCRRIFLPTIDTPIPLPKAVDLLKTDYPQSRLLSGSLKKTAPSLIAQPFDNRDHIIFVGPEGGLTEAEENLLQTAKADTVRITDTVLRIETAAIAFASILTAKRDALPAD